MKRAGLLTFAAVGLAAAVLAGLGYVSLRRWEAAAELLLREQARDMAAMAAEKVEMTVRKAEDDCLAGLAAALGGSRIEAGALDGWAAKAGLVARAYLFDRRGRLLYPGALAPGDAATIQALLADISPGFWDRGGRRHVPTGDGVTLAAVLPGPDGPVLAALVRNEDVLRRDVLGTSLQGLAGQSVLAVVDPGDRAVYASGPLRGAQRVLAVSFGEVLPSWRVAVYQPDGLSPRDVVRRQAMMVMAAFALLLVVIVVGLAATYRVVRRESEMARLKSDFVANVSHDLKTPLSLIRMFAETLALGRVTDAAARQEYYAVITRESERLTRLIDNVLDFSRIESGRQRYDIRPGPVSPVIHETLEAFRHPLAQQGFTVAVDVEAGLPDVAMDPAAVGQALANLVDNAVKYSGSGRRLAVSARRDPGRGEVLIEVADDGVGIAPGEVGRIFDKFYRIGRRDTRGHRGSGLGLALVKHVAEAHGGRVAVASRPGEGSRFTLCLPVAGDAECPRS